MTRFLLFEEGGDLTSVLARQVDGWPLHPHSLDQLAALLARGEGGVAPDLQAGPQLTPPHRDRGPP